MNQEFQQEYREEARQLLKSLEHSLLELEKIRRLTKSTTYTVTSTR